MAQPDNWVSFCPKGMDSDSLDMFFVEWEKYSKIVASQSELCEYNDLYDSIVVKLHREKIRTCKNFNRIMLDGKSRYPDEEFKVEPVPRYMLLLPRVRIKIYHRDFPLNEDPDITMSSADSISADTTIFFTPKIIEDRDISPLYVIEPAEQAVISFMTESVEHLRWNEASKRSFGKDKLDELEKRQDMVQNYIFIRRYMWCWPCWCWPSISTLIEEISIWNDGYYYSVSQDDRAGYTIFVDWNGNSETIIEWIS